MSFLDARILDAVRVEQVFSRPVLAHPALRQFGDECRAVLVRLMAYFGGLFALAVIVADLVSARLPVENTGSTVGRGPMAHERWNHAYRPHPAFAVVSPDLSDKMASYDILRHAAGGRKDIMHWNGADGALVGGVAIYRPGGEAESSDNTPESALADIATVQPGSIHLLGTIDSKFGPVQLLSATVSPNGRQCLGVLNTFAQPRMRMGALFCQNDLGAAARAQIACVMNRLTLLAAGSDPQLVQLFARADLKGRDCKTSPPSQPADWLSAMAGPNLRGRL